jgi:hypothetical protein
MNKYIMRNFMKKTLIDVEKSIEFLEIVLKEKGWSAETSGDPENWNEKNPAWGQCVVSALILQDILGGELVWGKVSGYSHYWNKIKGKEYDLTRKQFPENTEFPIGKERVPGLTTRAYALMAADVTRERYELLKNRIKLIYNV